MIRYILKWLAFPFVVIGSLAAGVVMGLGYGVGVATRSSVCVFLQLGYHWVGCSANELDADYMRWLEEGPCLLTHIKCLEEQVEQLKKDVAHERKFIEKTFDDERAAAFAALPDEEDDE